MQVPIQSVIQLCAPDPFALLQAQLSHRHAYEPQQRSWMVPWYQFAPCKHAPNFCRGGRSYCEYSHLVVRRYSVHLGHLLFPQKTSTVDTWGGATNTVTEHDLDKASNKKKSEAL